MPRAVGPVGHKPGTPHAMIPHARTPARPHARTPARPHARTPARPHARTPARPSLDLAARMPGRVRLLVPQPQPA
ncbi:hypothetical protein ACIP39_35790 [Streptomyces tibetensis]|uniref:hypothetical protein n=1 Tax=Streptomyces tibetensis TaxID=2382123 RepID=UPI0038028FAA